MKDRFPTFKRLGRVLMALPGRLARPAIRLVTVVAVIYPVGWLSAALSLRGCETDARKWVEGCIADSQVRGPLRWIERGSLVSWYDEHPLDRSEISFWWRLRLVAFPMVLYLPREFKPLPCGYVVAEKPVWPFIARVHYGCFAKNLYAEAGSRFYITFFGARVLLAQSPMYFW